MTPGVYLFNTKPEGKGNEYSDSIGVRSETRWKISAF